MLSKALEKSKTSLTKINIIDVLIYNDGFSHLITFLSENTNMFRFLEIENLLVSDSHCFRTLLQLFLRIPSKMTLVIKANIAKVEPKDVKTTLCAFLDENRSLKGNVSLSLMKMSKKMKVSDQKFLNSVAKRRKLFKHLFIMTKRGIVELDIKQ